MFDELLEKIGKTLDAHKVPYMIIGGQALLIYGEPRLTRDIDVTLGMDVEKLSEIQTVADKLSLRPLVENVEDFVNRTYVYPLQDDSTKIKVDFIFSFSEYERKAIKNARKVKIGETEVKFVSLEDLIIHKVIAGRPRDLEDLRILLLKNLEVDTAYIRKWLRDFDRSLKENYTRTFQELIEEIA